MTNVLTVELTPFVMIVAVQEVTAVAKYGNDQLNTNATDQMFYKIIEPETP